MSMARGACKVSNSVYCGVPLASCSRPASRLAQHVHQSSSSSLYLQRCLLPRHVMFFITCFMSLPV